MEGGHAREAPRSGPTSTLLAPQTRTLAPPQVHSGDAVFLDKERCFGVDVVPGGGGGGGLGDAAPRRAAKRSPTAGGGDQGADEESPPKKQAISAQSGVTVGPSPDASAKVSPSKATGASASTSPTASSRLLFAFVGVTHDGMMRRLAAERLRAKCVGLAASSAPPTGTTHVVLPNTPAPALAAALTRGAVLAVPLAGLDGAGEGVGEGLGVALADVVLPLPAAALGPAPPPTLAAVGVQDGKETAVPTPPGLSGAAAALGLASAVGVLRFARLPRTCWGEGGEGAGGGGGRHTAGPDGGGPVPLAAVVWPAASPPARIATAVQA